MEDVKVMKWVFTSEMLKPILSQLTTHHSSKIVAHWQHKQREWISAQQFVVHFGKGCSKMMTLCLNEWNIKIIPSHTYQGLKSMFESCNSHESFNDQLKQAWINRPGAIKYSTIFWSRHQSTWKIPMAFNKSHYYLKSTHCRKPKMPKAGRGIKRKRQITKTLQKSKKTK